MVPVSGISHSHLGVIVSTMWFCGVERDRMPIYKFNGDSALADTGRSIEMDHATRIILRNFSLKCSEDIGN